MGPLWATLIRIAEFREATEGRMASLKISVLRDILVTFNMHADPWNAKRALQRLTNILVVCNEFYVCLLPDNCGYREAIPEVSEI